LSNRASSKDDLVLAPEWTDWLIENYLEGVLPHELASALAEAGVPAELTSGALQEIQRNTSLRRVREKLIMRDQLLEVIQLKKQLEAQVSSRLVERRKCLSAQEFFDGYYSANRPVILTDTLTDWPALSLWSRPEYFAEKFGDTPVSVCMGRNADPHCDRNFHRHLTSMTMREYSSWVANAGETNDGYLISNNRLLENEAFQSLLHDVIPPEKYVDPERFRTHMSFWFGPAGTRTPLHHDGNNILFCQVVGRKEFYLVSPWETELLATAEGFYAGCQVPPDMESEGLRKANDDFRWNSLRVVLEPGEALFLPVGWWHQVRALEMSVSISFLNFRADNRFDWYAPGKLNETFGANMS
jgi:Cupin-like domain